MKNNSASIIIFPNTIKSVEPDGTFTINSAVELKNVLEEYKLIRCFAEPKRGHRVPVNLRKALDLAIDILNRE